MTAVMRIETERLLLREQLPSDAEAWGPLVVDPDFRRYVPVRRDDATPVERATRSLGSLMARWDKEPFRSAGWIVERRRDGRLIGTADIEESEAGDGELGYMFGKPYWGQGYGTEAAHAVARFGIERMGFDRLSAYIVPGNLGSIRIAEGIGLQFQGEVDYMQFFPDPSIIALSNPMTLMYAAGRDDLRLRDVGYRVIEKVGSAPGV